MVPTATETMAEISSWPSRALGSSAPSAPAPNPMASSTRIDGSRRTWPIRGAAAARTAMSPSSNRVRDWLSVANGSDETTAIIVVLRSRAQKSSRRVCSDRAGGLAGTVGQGHECPCPRDGEVRGHYGYGDRRDLERADLGREGGQQDQRER